MTERSEFFFELLVAAALGIALNPHLVSFVNSHSLIFSVLYGFFFLFLVGREELSDDEFVLSHSLIGGFGLIMGLNILMGQFEINYPASRYLVYALVSLSLFVSGADLLFAKIIPNLSHRVGKFLNNLFHLSDSQ